MSIISEADRPAMRCDSAGCAAAFAARPRRSDVRLLRTDAFLDGWRAFRDGGGSWRHACPDCTEAFAARMRADRAAARNGGRLL